VHAHPDDETINSGATMAAYVARGVSVALVTCTRGEEGEIIPAELGHLVAGRDDALGAERTRELASAMALLGVTDHRFLGEGEPGFAPRIYRDSGMAVAPDGTVVPAPDIRPDAFALADPDEAAARLATVIRRLRPQVLLTYEPGGGYGHPDHLQAHRVAMAAVELAEREDPACHGAGRAPWRVSKVYWSVLPESAADQAPAAPDRAVPSFVVPDDEVTTRVDAEAFVSAKAAALRAHATQVAVAPDGRSFTLADGAGMPLSGIEYYRLACGKFGAEVGPDGRESDLFDGIA